MNKIKKNDTVIVIAGDDKGKRGVVRRVVSASHVIVDNVKLVRKHLKANPQKNIQGGIVSQESPIPLSNVAIYNPDTQKKDKVRFKHLSDGKTVRVFASTGELVEG
jgi:large subunit ribosomal protein L24